MVTSGTGDFEYIALEICLKFFLSVVCYVKSRCSYRSSQWCIGFAGKLLSIIVNVILHV